MCGICGHRRRTLEDEQARAQTREDEQARAAAARADEEKARTAALEAEQAARRAKCARIEDEVQRWVREARAASKHMDTALPDINLGVDELSCIISFCDGRLMGLVRQVCHAWQESVELVTTDEYLARQSARVVLRLRPAPSDALRQMWTQRVASMTERDVDNLCSQSLFSEVAALADLRQLRAHEMLARRSKFADFGRDTCTFTVCGPPTAHPRDPTWSDPFRVAYNAAAQALGDRATDTANVGPLWRVTLEAHPTIKDAIKVILAGHHIGFVRNGGTTPKPGGFALLKGDCRVGNFMLGQRRLAQLLKHRLAQTHDPNYFPCLFVVAAASAQHPISPAIWGGDAIWGGEA